MFSNRHYLFISKNRGGVFPKPILLSVIFFIALITTLSVSNVIERGPGYPIIGDHKLIRRVPTNIYIHSVCVCLCGDIKGNR